MHGKPHLPSPEMMKDWKGWARSFKSELDNHFGSEKSPLVGSVSLAVAPATTTVLFNKRIRRGCTLFFTPTNALAAAEVGAGTFYMSPFATDGQITLNHAANAGARTFDYVVVS